MAFSSHSDHCRVAEVQDRGLQIAMTNVFETPCRPFVLGVQCVVTGRLQAHGFNVSLRDGLILIFGFRIHVQTPISTGTTV